MEEWTLKNLDCLCEGSKVMKDGFTFRSIQEHIENDNDIH